MPLSDIGPLAAQNQPIFQATPGMTPEQHLMAAYRAARAALSTTLPANTTLDALVAKVGDETYTNQLDANTPVIQTAIQQNQDLPKANGVSIGSNECRQYYLNKYMIACDGLGVYDSGFGRQMADSGTFPGDYDKSIDDKIRAFSEITYAQETGRLAQFVNAESVSSAVASGRMSLSGAAPTRTRIIVGTTGTTIEVVPTGAVGLGIAPIIVVGLVVVALGIITGAVIWSLYKTSIEETAATNREICKAAMSSGNEALANRCIDLAKESTDLGVVGNFLGKSGISDIGKYLFAGGAILLGIYFLPQITDRLLKSQDVAAAHKAARAAANRRRYR